MHYNRDDIKEFPIPPVRADIAKGDCLPCSWRIGIQASGGLPFGVDIDIQDTHIAHLHGGNDRWTFDAWLFVVFSDDTSTVGDKLGQTLESNGGELMWDDYSLTGSTAG
jgi:hypothetical protein